MSSIPSSIKLQDPAFFEFDDQTFQGLNDSLPARIFYSVLPFIALHKPAERAITLIASSVKSMSSLNQFVAKQDFKEFFKTALSITSLFSTFFMHPLGLFITNLYDFGSESLTFVSKLFAGSIDFSNFLSMTEHLFYLSTFLTGSLEIVTISLLLHISIEAWKTKKEFNSGRCVEGFAHLLMSLIRFSQALPYIEKLAYKYDINGKETLTSLRVTMGKIRNESAIFFYKMGRFFTIPHWKITDSWLSTISFCQDEQNSTFQKIFAVTKSTLSSLIRLPFALGGLALGQVCHFSASLLSTTPYIHLKGGKAFQVANKPLTVFQNNCCLTAGGFERLFGGVELSDEERVQAFASIIKTHHPDIVGLQEVSDSRDAFALYNTLYGEFSDFYLMIGPSSFCLKNPSGLFVASNIAIEDPEFCSFSDITGTESMVNKGFFIFSTQVANFIVTHLSPVHDDLSPTEDEILIHKKELERIVASAKKRSSINKLPSFLFGDLNLNWNNKEYKDLFTSLNFIDFYNEQRTTVSEDATAETEYLISRNWKHEKTLNPQHLIIDYFWQILADQRVKVTTKKVPTFDIYTPKAALSDHAGLFSQLFFEKS